MHSPQIAYNDMEDEMPSSKKKKKHKKEKKHRRSSASEEKDDGDWQQQQGTSSNLATKCTVKGYDESKSVKIFYFN